MWLMAADIASVRNRGARAATAVFLGLLAGIPVRAWGASASVLRVDSSAKGEIEIVAHRAPIAEVLRALAAEGGFEVVIDDRIARPPVNATVHMAPLEDVLREVLRDRNYAFVYDGDAEVNQVILLAPSEPRRPGTVSRARRKGAPSRGATVIRR